MKFPFTNKKKSSAAIKAHVHVPDSETYKMQTKVPNNKAVVLNMDQIHEKSSLDRSHPSGRRSFSTDKPKVSTIDDLSLGMTEFQGSDDSYSHRSFNLDTLKEDESVPGGDADSTAFSESCNSSANFSFTNESTGPESDNYPALYAPEKQKEFEEMKVLQLKKERYGMFHHFAPVLDFVSVSVNKVYGSISSYMQTIDYDKICGGTPTATTTK